MQPSVVLASLPWAPAQEPSLALGLLTAELRRHSIPTKALYLNTWLLKYVTYQTYVDVAAYWGLNEFVFTEVLSPDEDDSQIATLAERCSAMRANVSPSQRYPTPDELLEMLLRFRGEVALDYLEECADEILKHEPTLLGLTCMFDQTMASVALAKLVKGRSPETMVVLGGYALEGPPGEQVIKSFRWIDAIARGDGEPIIESLARASVGEADLHTIPGVETRSGRADCQVNIDLQDSPDPDYSDWFATISALAETDGIRIVTGALPVESSRGCWWGQRKHCVFCGIDDVTLRFRFKPAERTLKMLQSVRDLYGDHALRFSDYILPREYFTELLPELGRVEPRYRLHCEIKANQTSENVSLLARAGFEEVQPGIESFSSEVLRLMDKGVTGIQNVALLKYGYLERVVIHYNFLYGIPGETAEAYREMLDHIPRLYHLTPPVSRTEAIVTRFAPMQANTGRFGSSRSPVHHRCYDVLFSQRFLCRTGFSLDGYAYYFEPYLTFTDEMNKLYAQVVTQINHWKRLHRERQVIFSFLDDGTRLMFEDSRHIEVPTTRILEGVHRKVYLACDAAPVKIDAVVDDITQSSEYSAAEVLLALDDLDDARMIWREASRIFGLGVPKAVADERLASRWQERWTAIYK